MNFDSIIIHLHSLANPLNVEGMKRFGIHSKNVLGASTNELREMAKEIGKDHALAQMLWRTDIYDARVLAIFIEDPKLVTEKQMDRWVRDFDNWAVCDGCCVHLFYKALRVYEKTFEWTQSDREFIKRAGYVLMAVLAVHDKKASDKKFIRFFPIIIHGSTDERNFVKKAVNWSLRQIGKRNSALNKKAIQTAKEIYKLNTKSARWIASDALRELTSEAVQKRLSSKK